MKNVIVCILLFVFISKVHAQTLHEEVQKVTPHLLTASEQQKLLKNKFSLP